MSESTILASLARLLRGSRVSSVAVTDALELLCRETAFSCGLLYEVNSSGRLRLMERTASCPPGLPALVPADVLSEQDLCELAQTDLLCLPRPILLSTTLHRRLLAFYGAQTLLLAPIVDESRRLYGFVSLFAANAPAPDEQEQDFLSLPLSMLVHYLRGRVYQKQLAHSWMTMERVLDNTGIDIYVNDYNTHDILYVNRSMAAPYGGKASFDGQKCWSVLFPGQNGPCEFCPRDRLLDADGKPGDVYSWDYQRPFDGSWFRVFSTAFYWEDGRLAHIISSADITDNKRNEALIANLANFDQLTGLPNRRSLINECSRRIENATTTEQGYVLFFDIDGFKTINDTLGHDAGDEFLVQLGAFFSSIPLLKDSIYRNGGDEFVAVLGGETVSKANIISLGRFIHQRFEKPWQLKNGVARCNTSIGVACFPEDGGTAETLLQKADQAMYHVKKTGGGRLCFGYELQAP